MKRSALARPSSNGWRRKPRSVLNFEETFRAAEFVLGFDGVNEHAGVYRGIEGDLTMPTGGRDWRSVDVD